MTQSASPALQSAAAAGVDRENPWPGLAAFTEEISEFFFGREAETQELFRLVKRETLTILFGQSGLGKSSLLQAGLSPKLRAADLLPVYLRLDHAVGGAPLAEQVKAAIAKKIAAREIDGTAPGGEGQTLWEYFHHKDAEFWTPKNQLATPVLIFDQFEELFTLGRSSDTARARGEAFIEQLADLIENRMPAGLRQRINDGGASSEAYVYDDPGCKILLSLREDYLPDLEGLRARIRSIMQNRMRIRRMNGAQALDVVEKAGGDLVEKGVAPWIVHFVSTAGAQSETAAPSDHLEELEVEPALLSIFCRELNNKRKRQGQAQITAGLLKESRKGILSDFYQHSVEDLPEQVRVFVEDKLLTASGFRDNYALENALLEPGVTREVLERLVTRRLLRVDDRQGVQRVELTHDVLAAPIRASRDERQHRLALARAAEREHEARRKLGQARQRIALYIALAGLAVSAPLLWYSFHQKAEAMQQRGAAMAEKENADKARRAAERSARDTTEALGVANKALRDYYALKVQLALQQTPPEAMVAEMLLRHAVAGNTFEHGDVVDTLIPAAPFAAEKSVKLDRPVSRLLYSPDATLMVAVGPGAPPAAPAGPGAGAGGSGLTLIDGATGAATPWKMPEDLAKATISDVCFEPAAAAGGTGRLAVRMLDPDAGDIIVRWDCGKRQEVLPRLRLTKWPVAAPERGNDPGTGGSADAGKPAGARPPGTPAAAPAPPAPGKESKALVIAMPMAFHPEGTKLAAAGPEGLIGIFDLATIPAQDKYADLAPTDTTRTPEATATGDFSLPTAGMGVRTPPPASKAPVQAIAYSQQGSVLLAQTAAATFSWLSDEVNLAGAHVVERLDTNLVPTGLAVSPPGARFCTLLKNQSLNSGGKVTLWHYYAGSTNPTHEEYDIDRTTINESATINAAAYSMDGQWLATGTDHGVRVYWSHANMAMQALPQNGRATAIAFRPDGMGLVTAAESPKSEGEGTTLQFWRTSSRAAAPARGLGEEETLQAVTPGGKSILVLNHRVLRVFEVNSGKLQAEYQFPGSGGFSDMVLRDDLHPIVAINDGKGLVVTDAAEGRGLVRIPPMETINFMRLSPDGRYFVVSGEDERARLYDLTGAAPMREFDLAEPGAATRRAAAAGPGDDLFDLGDYHFVDQYAAFSHDGKKLAVFSFDGQVVRQYALADGKFLSKFSVNEDIASLAYSGDDTMFLYGVDRHLVCFDPALGRPIIDVRRPEYFSRISISADNRVCVVDAAPAAGLFLRPQAPASMEDLHAAARRTLDEHQNAVPFTPAQSGITPPEPVVARFWSAWLETQRRVQLTSHDGGNVISGAAVARAYEPLRTLFEQNPDAAYPAAAQAAREALRFLTPLTGAPPAAELTRRAAFIEGRAPVERIVLLRDLLAHLEARDPHRAALSAALAGAYSERIEDVEWHDDTERDIEIGAAFEALQQAIAAGYSDWRLINDTVSSRALKSDIRYCVLFERMIRDLPADAPGRADGIAQAATAWTRRVTNNRWPEFDTPERREAVDKAFALMRQAIDLGYRDWHEVHWQFDAY
ncbi:MAG TPA: WD40 repeat domain-containing protein, partial [Phycisphaerae bacterium]|nr:WD40 repeat domain-containing protein [Phycisphaerae bacterium]